MTKKNFIIELIDDHYDNMERQMEEIKEFLEEKGFELELLPCKKGDKIIKHLTEKDIDIILTDKNLGSKSAIDIVKEVRRNKFLTDILYYSGVSIDDSDILQLGKYFNVEVVNDREIVAPLKKLIRKNLQKWEDVIFLRGVIISETIELETKMNEFFTKYFKVTGEPSKHFDLILEGTAISMEGKKSALTKIIEKNGLKDEYGTLNADIGNAQQERNILAHCKLNPNAKNSFISKGEGSAPYDKDKMARILKKIEQAHEKLDRLIEKFSG